MGHQERSDLLDSHVEGDPDSSLWYELEKMHGPRINSILSYFSVNKLDGQVLQISKKLYQVKIPRVNASPNQKGFNLLDALDFSTPFLKQFSNAQFQVLKKSYQKSLKSPKAQTPSQPQMKAKPSLKFPTSFVPLKPKKTAKPLIDFKPLYDSNRKSDRIPSNTQNGGEKEAQSKGNKMKELVQIMKKRLEPEKRKNEQIDEKNKLDAMFDDIFTGD